MAIARHDLRGDGLCGQAEPVEHTALVVRSERGVGADRAGDRARGGLCKRPLEALGVAMRLEREAGELEAERGRLGVDAVGAADADGVGELAGALGERGRERAGAGDDHVAGAAQLQREGGVEHVGGREPVVDPAAGLARRRAEHVDERRDVVVGDPLALLHGLDGEGGGPDRLEVGFGGAVEGLGGGDLDVAPGGHPRLIRPHGADLGPGVALDHLGGL